MKENSVKQNAIVFGIGRNYHHLYAPICAEYNIIALSDNNCDKWNGTDTLSGKLIVAPQKIKDYMVGDCKLLITPANYGEIVYQLLMQLNLSQVSVCISMIDAQRLKLVEFFMENDIITLLYNSFEIKVRASYERVLSILLEIFAKEEYGIEYPFNSNSDGAVVIDIGMNVGCASLYFANLMNVTKVYSYEPFKENYCEALSNFALNPNLSSKIVPHNFGLGNGNYLLSVNGGISCRKDISGELLQITINDAAEILGPIIDEHGKMGKIWLKCDCEGGEYDIFESLGKDLLSKIDIITMEWHGHCDKLKFLKEMLLKNGFAFRVDCNLVVDLGMIYALNIKRDENS